MKIAIPVVMGEPPKVSEDAPAVALVTWAQATSAPKPAKMRARISLPKVSHRPYMRR